MQQAKLLNNLKDHDHHHLHTTKNMKRFHQQSCSSWKDHQEEAAFANDAILGAQGGSIWPQRSYSCSFCKREFRSAQALGGHMNVHRRDRALLKQVITTHIVDHHDHNLHQTHHDHNHMISRPPRSKLPQNLPQVCCPETSVAHLSLSRLSSNSVISGVRKVISSTNDVVEAKMSLGLDLAVGTFQNEDDNLEECLKYSKRFKKNGDYRVALFPFFEEIKCSNVKDNRRLQIPEILSLTATKSTEDLDLELRLGDSLNKVK